MNLNTIQTHFPTIGNLDLLKVVLIDLIRPTVERSNKGIKDLRVLDIQSSILISDIDYFIITWTGTLVMLDQWTRAYNYYPKDTIAVSKSDILSLYREYQLDKVLTQLDYSNG